MQPKAKIIESLFSCKRGKDTEMRDMGRNC